MRRKLTPRSFAAVTAPHAARVEMRERAAAELDAIVGEAKKSAPKFNREKVLLECDEMRVKKDWANARPAHAVALYARCHEHVYGFMPEELWGNGEGPRRERLGAMSAAASLLKREFEGNFEKLVAFMQWSWGDEQRKCKWAKDRGIELSKRMGWRRQFSIGLVGDYRRVLLTRKTAAE